jgi:citrate synthase
MDDDKKVQIHRGLNGVYFDRSKVCDIDGKAGELRYRGYSIHDLAEQSTFEEACYLSSMATCRRRRSWRNFPLG